MSTPHTTAEQHAPPTVPPQHLASPEADTRSVGAIVADISTDLSALVRQEMELAKTEFKAEASKTAKGAGMLGGAGVAGFFTLFFLSLALTYVLANGLPVELASLITALLWGAAAGALAVVGKKRVQEANPQLPKTQQTLKEDVRWAQAQKS